MADRIIGGGKFRVGDRDNWKLEQLEKYLEKAKIIHIDLLNQVEDMEEKIENIQEQINVLRGRTVISLTDEIWEL